MQKAQVAPKPRRDPLEINQEHPKYIARRAMWKQHKQDYAGSESIRSISDWCAAALLEPEPLLQITGSDSAADAFYSQFADNCDLKGTSFGEFFRKRLAQALVYGSSYIVVDFPRASTAALNRAGQDSSGRRAFLVGYGPDAVINWSYDMPGTLDWAVIRTSCRQQVDTRWERETQWVYYDREHFQIYHRTAADKPIQRIETGQHGLAALRQVPLFHLRVSERLWLMNRPALLLRAYGDAVMETMEQILGGIRVARRDPITIEVSSTGSVPPPSGGGKGADLPGGDVGPAWAFGARAIRLLRAS